MSKKHNKITSGFVIQEYEENKDGFFECVRQVFEAGDPVEYETFSGEPVDIDTDREVYQPFDMVQPDKDWYVLQLWSCVEPVLHGPYDYDNANIVLEELREKEGEEEHTFMLVSVTKGAKLEV